jgi:hypothetical protein
MSQKMEFLAIKYRNHFQKGWPFATPATVPLDGANLLLDGTHCKDDSVGIVPSYDSKEHLPKDAIDVEMYMARD